MKIFEFVLLGLATWRISNMLAKEDGPSHVFERMRYRLGIRHQEKNPDETYAKDPDSFFATLLLCPWCLSLHVATGWFVLYLWRPIFAVRLAIPMALSAIACLIDRSGQD